MKPADSRSKIRLLVTAVALLIAASIYWIKQGRPRLLGETPVPAASPFITAPQVAGKPARTRASSLGPKETSDIAERFKKRFGSALVLKTDTAGCLISILGNPRTASPAEGRFAPNDSVLALARAREVITAAADLLCLDPTSPLGDPLMSSSPVSVQASFHELRQGMPVIPFGSIVLTLGGRGEVLRLDSSYSGTGEIINERKLTADQARERAMEVFPKETDYSGKSLEGRPVLWISARSEGGRAKSLLHAYEYVSHGKQVIVDAYDGTILEQRDRRMQ